MVKNVPVPVHESPSLLALQGILESGPPAPDRLSALIAALEEERHLEHGLSLLKQARLEPGPWADTLAQMKAAVAKSRTRRMSLWQVDPYRRTLRLRVEVRQPACALNPSALASALARLLMDAGLPVAMGLEKSPRPALSLGHPLPLEVEGWREWADVVLQEGPSVALEALPALINGHAGSGLRILDCALVPNHASPVADLCVQASWVWPCPQPLLEQARAQVTAFLAAERFEIAKPGKVDGQKAAKPVDIRPLLSELHWQGDALAFQTRIGPGLAPNPRKFLAGILAVPVEAILGLVRTEVTLQEDPRLLQAEKFLPKLHNMYEDAVLLDSGSNIRIVEDDDDEPLILG